MTDLVQTKQINEYILEVSLNRPEKLNALTKPMWKKLGSIFRDLAKKKNKDIRCVVIRGKGGKSFSPGNDIGEFANSPISFPGEKDFPPFPLITTHRISLFFFFARSLKIEPSFFHIGLVNAFSFSGLFNETSRMYSFICFV